jgi:hypothetical protein
LRGLETGKLGESAGDEHISWEVRALTLIPKQQSVKGLNVVSI